MSKKKQQNFLQGAAILAATAAIVKVMGAIYKIPLGNILGDKGYGHFSVAYSIYTLLLNLSSAGLPVALSRMIAAYNAEGRLKQVDRTFSVARATFFVLGMTATLIMMLFPTQLAAMMDDIEAAPGIRALAPSVVLVCLMSAYRGYAQGLSDMIPTSISQILEVLGKTVFGLILAWWMVSEGRGLAMGAAGAITGVTIGSLMALIYVIYYYNKLKRNTRSVAYGADIPLARSATLKRLVTIAIPIAIGSSIISVLGLIDTKLILNRLQEAAEFSYEQAMVYFGVYAKAQTLFNLPSSFIVPVTISVVPAISACIAVKNSTGATRVTETSMKLTSLLAMPAGIGLSILSYPIFNVLYRGSHSEGPVLLTIMGIASFFVCMTLITNAILQACGYERFPVYTMAIGGIIKIALTWILVSNPDIAVRGAAISTLMCFLIISVINIVFLLNKLPEKLSMTRIFVKPTVASLIMGATAYVVYNSLQRLLSGAGIDPESRTVLLIAMLAAILAAVIIYLIMIVLLKAITKEDLEFLPKGGKIARFLRMK